MSNLISLSIQASAPSKFILSGEYSVVFGRRAIALSLDLRTTVTINQNFSNLVQLKLDCFEQVREWNVSELRLKKILDTPNEPYVYEGWPNNLNQLLGGEFIVCNKRKDDEETQRMAEDATKAFLLIFLSIGDCYDFGNRKSINASVVSAIPPGSGLGSSSSYSVSMCSAIFKLYEVSITDEHLSDWALQIDKYFHKKPSGIDTSVAVYGGCVLFQNFKVIGTKKFPQPVKVLLVHSGVSRSTKALVERVCEERSRNIESYDSLFDNIDSITGEIWNKIHIDSNIYNIQTFLKENQKLLEKLRVNHVKLEEIINCCGEYGFVAKLTGAGGGGFAFTTYDSSSEDNLNKLKACLKLKGFEYFDVSAGVEGVRVTKMSDNKL